MSVDLIVYLRRSAMPTPAAWQQAIRDGGFPVKMDTDIDPDTFSGFLPCELRGAVSGFEYFAAPLSDKKAVELGAPAGAGLLCHVGDALRPAGVRLFGRGGSGAWRAPAADCWSIRSPVSPSQGLTQ